MATALSVLLACQCVAHGAGYAPWPDLTGGAVGKQSRPAGGLLVLALRGGGEGGGRSIDDTLVLAHDADNLLHNHTQWEVEHVLVFLERLRHKFKDRTDLYRKLFSDNDVDGTVLMGLTGEKLEKARSPAVHLA